MNKICQGCGAKFQSLNQSSPGYIPKEKAIDGVYCERCFKIIHYGESLVVLAPSEINSIIETVNNNENHVLFVLDLLSLNQDIVDLYNKITNAKTLIVSKFDLLSNVIKPNKIKDFLNTHYQIKDNILFVSSHNENSIDELIDYLLKYKINKAYLVGFINSGKSTLINTILKRQNQVILDLTTSFIPHTTMNFIEIKINKNLKLIDSPGFSYPNFLNNNLKILRKIDIKKRIKPLNYQMKKDQLLLIEDLINITFSNKSNVTVYLSNKFKLKKGFKITRHHLKMKVPSNSDLVIKGIGFINFKNNCEIEIDLEEKNLIEIRPSLFGGK